MLPGAHEPETAIVNPFAAADIATILAERGWLDPTREWEADASLQTWLARAAELLGPHVADPQGMANLLALIFTYDAAVVLQEPLNQAVLARTGAREVIRTLANCVLDGGEMDSDHFKEVLEAIKAAVPYRSRVLLHPIRLALAGRAGEGELDRVILLLDGAAKLPFTSPAKGTRQRMLEFCAALD